MSLRVGVACAALLTLVSCTKTRLNGQGCNQDSDCGAPAAAFRCEVETGVCYCRTNQACPPSQFCNTIGFCQDRAGCEKNADCLDPSLFCDTSTGTCLSRGRCASDLQCELGQVCDTRRSVCVEGCHKQGDCQGSACRCGDVACACTGTTPEEISRCALGVCDPNFCANETNCRFGELCGAQPDAGTTRASCYSDYSSDVRPYCDNCTFGGGTNICGHGANYCLIDTRHPGNSYCGADCSEGQACPRGHSCEDVIVVSTQWACSRANPGCPTNAQKPCMTDANCPRGGQCIKESGQAMGLCAGRCGVSEGDNEGFCSCLVDADCAQETCSAGECSISRKRCVNDTDCRTIRCVDFEGGGGCLIGQNCAPSNGLTCNEVR